MTHIAEISDGTAIFTEFTATSHVANNSKIIWNTTPRSTGTPGITIDNSGNITLSGGRAFWLIVSLDATRVNTSSNVYMEWQDNNNNTISQSGGASPIMYKVTGSPTANAVGMFATNITIGGSQTLSFKYIGTSNLTINTSMTLLAIEIGRT